MNIKRTVFLMCIMFLCINISAQTTKEYNDLIFSIDSVKVKYSVKRFLYVSDFPYDFQRNYGTSLSQLQIEEQNKIIDYVCDLYNQKECIGLYGLAGELLKGFHGFSKEETIRKRIIEIWYRKICYMSSTIVGIGRSSDYTDNTKDRLLEITKKQWDKEDINAWNLFIEQNIDINRYKKEVKKIMQETQRQGESTEIYLLDSLVQKEKDKRLNMYINRPVSNGCILMIGSLNDQRFVPALENMLEEYKENKDYPEIKEACTYALAKLGVQKYIEEVLSNDSVIHWRYLGTKEGFLRWLDINREWNKWVRVCSSCGYLPVPLFTLWQAQDFLKNNNMPKEIRLLPIQDIEHFDNSVIGENYDPLMDEKNKSTIEKTYKLYNWIKENTDKWELPPAKDTF